MRGAITRAQVEHGQPVVTTIEPLADWYVAEDYYREYFDPEGASNPYCQIVVAPKLAKFRKKHVGRLNGVTV